MRGTIEVCNHFQINWLRSAIKQRLKWKYEQLQNTDLLALANCTQQIISNIPVQTVSGPYLDH